MTIVSQPRSKSEGGRSSSPPASICKKRQPTRAEEPERAAETIMIVPTTGDADPEKAVHTHDAVQEEELSSTAAITAPALRDVAAHSASLNNFGRGSDEYLGGYKLVAALFGIACVFFIVLLDFSITSTAIPYITSDFHSLQDIGWYGSAYVLASRIEPDFPDTSAALQPLTGKLYTYLPVKQMFLFFVFIFEIGSLLCAVSTSSMFFILGRTVAGLGSSGLENGALNLIAGAVPPHKRPFYNGVVFGVCQMGIVVGPLVGGALTQYVTWRWCFYINLPIGAVPGLFLFFTKIPDEIIKPPFSFALLRSIVHNLDLAGFALFVPAIVMFLLGLHWGSTGYGWSSFTVIGLFAGSGATSILFAIWEQRMGEQALIPFHVVKRRIVWASTIQNASLFVNNFVGVNYVPIYFQAVKGVGPSLSGVYMLPSIVTQFLSLIVSGALVGRLGYYLPFSILAGATTAIACGLIATWDPDTSQADWIGYQILFGLRGMGLQTAITSVQNAVTPAESPTVIAFMIFVENLVSAIFTIVGNSIFTQTLTRQVFVLAPSVNPEAALAAGGSAEAVRALLPPRSPELYGLLFAYSNSVNAVFYLLAALAVVAFIASWGMGWVDIRKKAPAEVRT